MWNWEQRDWLEVGKTLACCVQERLECCLPAVSGAQIRLPANTRAQKFHSATTIPGESALYTPTSLHHPTHTPHQAHFTSVCSTDTHPLTERKEVAFPTKHCNWAKKIWHLEMQQQQHLNNMGWWVTDDCSMPWPDLHTHTKHKSPTQSPLITRLHADGSLICTHDWRRLGHSILCRAHLLLQVACR